MWDLREQLIDLNRHLRVHCTRVHEDLGLVRCPTLLSHFEYLSDVMVDGSDDVVRAERGEGDVCECGEFARGIDDFDFGFTNFLDGI